jgi:hypothetical protein
LHARRCAAPRALVVGVPHAPHKGKFFRDMIEQPIALFETLHRDFFNLRDCIEMQLQVQMPLPQSLFC